MDTTNWKIKYMKYKTKYIELKKNFKKVVIKNKKL